MTGERQSGCPLGDFDSSVFRPRRLADEVTPILRQSILSGTFAPGERLNEVELAAQLNISRPPIREALQALIGEGLVRTVAGRGTFVASFDLETVGHLAEVRQALECAAARLAAVRADDAALDELEKFLVRTGEALGDPDRPYPRDLDFHQQILEMSGNPRLVDTARGVTTQLRLARARSGGVPDRARAAYTEHHRIYRALRERDPEAAAAAMADHLDAAQAHVRQLLPDRDSEETR
ncbi:GntR family transcriptional regulator [Nocardia sp. alder85J]|uniref:GntR family transcriptional regulator n=1 Tax=Nocardia sp. alder85J TaxID=2862949 RepID=UPI001CD52812|nr:GntR family transcriptional regulator [Nocardia sp. alder85J]MCX4094644.1 GntR family transcriptional regulator [Nocardia sp. alder85J]